MQKRCAHQVIFLLGVSIPVLYVILVDHLVVFGFASTVIAATSLLNLILAKKSASAVALLEAWAKSHGKRPLTGQELTLINDCNMGELAAELVKMNNESSRRTDRFLDFNKIITKKEKRFRIAHEVAKVECWEYHPGAGIVDIGRWATVLFGDEVRGPAVQASALLRSLSLSDTTALLSAIRLALRTGGKFTIKHSVKLYSGKTMTVLTSGRVEKCDKGACLVGASVDISEYAKIEKSLEYVRRYDNLTGLINKSTFMEVLDGALAASFRASRPLALAVVGVDGLKRVSEMQGLATSDELIRRIASKIKEMVGIQNGVCRFSVDEFLILYPDSEPDDAREFTDEVIAEIAKTKQAWGADASLIAHAGMASIVPGEAQISAEEIIRRAEIALEQARVGAQGVCEFYNEIFAKERNYYARLETDLAIAAKDMQQFEIYGQKKICLSTGLMTGIEILLRWNHPEEGLVPPAHFIPIAEENGLIVQIGEWVIRESIKAVARWDAQGIDVGTVAINLSLVQLEDRALPQMVDRLLRMARVSADRIEFEITESLPIENMDAMLEIIKDLRQIGAKIAIDDFGSGYSSLGQIKRFQADTLKIDRSFVQNMEHDRDYEEIIKAICAIAKVLRMQTVIEGIETANQAKIAREIGCDIAQGYLYGKPAPAAEIATFDRQHFCALPDVEAI